MVHPLFLPYHRIGVRLPYRVLEDRLGSSQLELIVLWMVVRDLGRLDAAFRDA